MKINTQEKVYKITYGATPIQRRNNGKPILNEDSPSWDELNVKAKDVYEALNFTEKYLLKLEKEAHKEDMQIYVESVELLNYIDDLRDSIK